MKFSKSSLAIGLIVGVVATSAVDMTVLKKDEPKYAEGAAQAIDWQLNSGEALAAQYQAYHNATKTLEEKSKVKSEKKKAVILDIDETVLNNYGSLADDYKHGEVYTKEKFSKWVAEEECTIIKGADKFLNTANELGIDVYYISNRYTNDLDATIKNMKKLGLPFADKEHIFLRDKEGNKLDRVDKVRKDHDVVMFVGDNLGDFPADFDKKLNDERQDKVNQMQDKFGTDYIIIPNPSYGDFEYATFGYDFSKTDKQKTDMRNNAIDKLAK